MLQRTLSITWKDNPQNGGKHENHASDILDIYLEYIYVTFTSQ